MVEGVSALVVVYLLGAIPSAYIITRLQAGKDIRQLGGGNVGARNVFREVGLGAAIAVGIFDVGKGAGAVLIASWWLDWPSMRLVDTAQVFVLAAGVAVVVGHIWPVYLKFNGGNGLATTIGVLSVLLTRELLIALALALLFIIITRNPILSVNISLLSVPVSALFMEQSWLLVVCPIVLLLIMAINFLPARKTALAESGKKDGFFAEYLRRNKAKTERK